MTEEHFIFPLGTVLFPGGALPLKIFEQRYLEMTKACLREQRPFGVCLIREGREVGAPALPEKVGCLAAIEQWDMPHLGMFRLLARGTARFRLLESRVAGNGLMSGVVERIEDTAPPAAVDPACRALLERIIARVGESSFPAPIALDDPAWVGYRLAEILPLDPRFKQQMLELSDAGERLARLRQALLDGGLIET